MLICRDVTELTTDYLEGTLPWPRRLAMRWHLAICSFCRRHLRQVRATVGLLHTLRPVPPPAPLVDRLVAQAQAAAGGDGDGAPEPPS